MVDSVDDLRREIDDLDNNLHDLLMKRADLVKKIGEEKRRNKIQVIQPDREAVMIRRLMDRHHGALPRHAVVRIWRELVGAVSLLQTDVKVIVCAPDEQMTEAWDMAKNYFGSVVPMQKMTNPMNALSMVKEGEVTFAVLPWPDDQDPKPWWAYMRGESPEKIAHIVASLPYGSGVDSRTRPGFKALVVGCLKFNDSGNDHSFLFLDLDDSISRARIVDRLKAMGLTPLSLLSRKGHPGLERTQHFVEVDRYIANGEMTDQILVKLENTDGNCICLGGYPVIPALES
ncbi:chorismate mutase [Micavibrio aeruginosavorus]|uniref:chorismate mutase n=1 Tax=Micavibrio aeruginosavorus EPB TaxID=349215 RepID=M4VI81_9BACT|nr:chorismate mutase [Micavibrio aeruginosavorus]AGH98195.1 chorismate mutase [Micavibrio aeruginosavorus EPB]